MVKRGLAVGLAAVLLWPALIFAQTSKAGVVTVLEGNVTARRGAPPAPVPLKFKDDVFLQDTVTTGDKALARMLLGGKAVVTVRERSVLTITEVPGRSTLELQSGKFALAVAREKLAPGEEIQIRTPNAVAGVRGTVVITEVARQGAQVGAGAPAVLTNFFVLRGSIVAQPLDAARQPLGASLQVGNMQSYSGAGLATPRVQPIPPDQVAGIIAGLQPTGPKGGSDAAKDQVKSQQMGTAVALVGALTGDQAAFATALPSNLVLPATLVTDGTGGGAVIDPCHSTTDICQSEFEALTSSSGASAQVTSLCPACVRVSGSTFVLAGQPFHTFSGNLTSTSELALLGIDTSLATQTGTSISFIEVPGGVVVSLGGQLIVITNSTIDTSGTFLSILGQLTSTSTSAFMSLDPTTVKTGDAFIVMNGGSLTLAGPLVTDTNGTLAIGTEFLRMVNATLTSTTPQALVQLDGTTVGGMSALKMSGSTMNLAGPLVTAKSVTGTESSSGLIATSTFLIDTSTLTSTSTSPLIQLTSTSLESDDNFLHVINGSTVTLGGSLLSTSGGSIETGDAFIVLNGGSLTLAGPLVTDTNGTLAIGSEFVRMVNATLTSTTPQALVQLDGTTVGGTSALNMSGSTMNLAGPLVTAKSVTGTESASGPIATPTFLIDTSTLTSTGTSPLIQLTSMSFASDENFIHVINGSTVTLGSPLLSTSASSIGARFDLVQILRSAFTSTTTSPLIDVTGGTIALGVPDPVTGISSNGDLLRLASFGVAGSPAVMNLAGPYARLTQTTATMTGAALLIDGATFAGTGTGALLQLVNSSLSAGFRLFDSQRSSLTSAGPILSATDSTITLGIDVIRTSGTFVSTSTSPLIDLVRSPLTVPSSAFATGILFDLQSAPTASTGAIAGPILRAVNSAVNLRQSGLRVFNSTLVSTSLQPLFQLDASSMTFGDNAILFNVQGGQMTMAGPILTAVNGSSVSLATFASLFLSVGSVLNVATQSGALVSFSGASTLAATRLLVAANDNAFTTNGSTGPLFSFTGASHTLSTSTFPAIRLAGVNVAGEAVEVDDLDGGLTLDSNYQVATDQPLKHGGSLIDGEATTLTMASGVTLDKALLQASAPLLHLKNGTTLNVLTGNGVDMVNQAKLVSLVGPVIKLDASTMNIVSGHGINLAGGSFLKVVSGDLITLNNGSLLKIESGHLLNLAGNSVLQINNGTVLSINNSNATVNGAFVNFNAGPGALNVTNSLTPNLSCGTCGGLKIAFINGALEGNVTVTGSPIQGSGTASFSGAAILMEGSAAKLTISGN